MLVGNWEEGELGVHFEGCAGLLVMVCVGLRGELEFMMRYWGVLVVQCVRREGWSVVV